MTTYDLSTFGEPQIRLTVPAGDRLATCRELRLTPACSEANVAGLLAQLNRPTAYSSVIPHGDLAQRFIDEYRGVGVDLSHSIRCEGRIALYFMEPGEYPLPAKVTYDRLYTGFRELTPDMLDWDAVLDTRVLFVTGITAALTEQTAETITFAVHEASKRGVKVALDVNYRSLLWTPDRARSVLEPLLPHTDILFCSRLDGIKVFGLEGEGPAVNRELQQRYGVPHVVSTDSIAGCYYTGEQGHEVFAVEAIPVKDRPGAGDSFVGGTLHGYLEGDVLAGIEYGMRTSKLALTHFGDLTHCAAAELAIPTTTDIVR